MVGLLITNHKSLVINMLCYACWQLDSQPVTMLCADQGWFSADRCNSSTCGWSRRREASKISAMNTWAGFTPTLLTCDSAVLYWHTNWNNSTNQQFVMRWNIFPKQEALHSNECLQDCGVRKWDHPPLRNRTENRSELIIRTGSRWFK